MIRLLMFAVPLVTACTDFGYHAYSCYEGETCSVDTPNNLEFRGMDVAGDSGGQPGRTAIGGTQMIKVLDPTDDFTSPGVFKRPYTTDTTLPADARFGLGVEVVDHAGHVITVRGFADGENYLRVLARDGTLYGRTILAAAAIAHRQVRPRYEYGGPDADEEIVWVPGEHDISVGLWATPLYETESSLDLLVDESMTLALPGATQTRWDTIRTPVASVGHRDLVVTAGSGAVVLDVETVAAPDSIEGASENYYSGSPSGSTLLCFVARHGTRYVAGVRWSFTVVGGQVLTSDVIDTPRSGCAYFAGNGQRTLHVSATASGFTQIVDVTAP